MGKCDLCMGLVGNPSSIPPHEKLVGAGVSCFGHGGNLEKICDRWKCQTCGAYMLQNTNYGEPKNEWSIGNRPAGLPEV